MLERLEAKQEKCVAEVDFTRHVLICKLQRLENKLEESLSIADSNNNNTEEREKNIEEIREEMSKECRDLRKLLQETSNQLKQVLEERPIPSQNDENTMNTKFNETQKGKILIFKKSLIYYKKHCTIEQGVPHFGQLQTLIYLFLLYY